MNVQSRETDNIVYTRQRTKTNRVKTQHRQLRRWARPIHQIQTMNPGARAAIIIIIIPVV